MKARVTKTPYHCSIIIPCLEQCRSDPAMSDGAARVTEGVTYEVVLVDNGSTDGVQDFLQTLGGDVQVIRNQENLGFAKACNQGARAARGEYLVFLNNDTIPLEGWLAPLIEEVRTHSDVAVVGSKLLFEDGTFNMRASHFPANGSFPTTSIAARCPGRRVSRRREFQCVTQPACLYDERYSNRWEDSRRLSEWF